MKNSIKEDIERLELCSTNKCNICGRYEKEECMLERNRCEQHILSAYRRVLKENEELRCENGKLRTIRYDTKYGTENIHLITERNLAEINTNKYLIEIEDREFVDLKQVYQENKDLKADNYELNNRITDLLENIPVRKIKDKIEELKEDKDSKYYDIFLEERDIENTIKILQEILD